MRAHRDARASVRPPTAGANASRCGGANARARSPLGSRGLRHATVRPTGRAIARGRADGRCDGDGLRGGGRGRRLGTGRRSAGGSAFPGRSRSSSTGGVVAATPAGGHARRGARARDRRPTPRTPRARRGRCARPGHMSAASIPCRARAVLFARDRQGARRSRDGGRAVRRGHVAEARRRIASRARGGTEAIEAHAQEIAVVDSVRGDQREATAWSSSFGDPPFSNEASMRMVDARRRASPLPAASRCRPDTRAAGSRPRSAPARATPPRSHGRRRAGRGSSGTREGSPPIPAAAHRHDSPRRSPRRSRWSRSQRAGAAAKLARPAAACRIWTPSVTVMRATVVRVAATVSWRGTDPPPTP